METRCKFFLFPTKFNRGKKKKKKKRKPKTFPFSFQDFQLRPTVLYKTGITAGTNGQHYQYLTKTVWKDLFTEEFHLFIEQKHKSFMLHIPQVIM